MRAMVHSPAPRMPRILAQPLRFSALRTLFHSVLDFCDAGPGAFFVKVSAGSAAYADPADRVSAAHYGYTADRISNIRQRRLRHGGRRVLAHPVGDRLGAVLLARERQRCR